MRKSSPAGVGDSGGDSGGHALGLASAYEGDRLDLIAGRQLDPAAQTPRYDLAVALDRHLLGVSPGPEQLSQTWPAAMSLGWPLT